MMVCVRFILRDGNDFKESKFNDFEKISLLPGFNLETTC
jgi:hypothetical protein